MTFNTLQPIAISWLCMWDT